MKTFPPARIRNVALVGHGGAGKTSLAEALLYCSGATSRLGKVEDGNTVSDFEPEEVKRKLSTSVSVVPLVHGEHKINLLDAPGYADFDYEVSTALTVADMAVFVISAVDGVEVGTEAAWRQAASLGLPRMFFVNKLDRERADFQTVLESLRDRFGAGVAPLELPIGSESGLRGIADLLTDGAFVYDGGDPRSPTRVDVPGEISDVEHQVREALVEGIVVADDALMERYLDGDLPSPKELEETLAKGVAEASVFPVLCGSATRLVGVDRLADMLCEIGPSPLERPPVVVKGPDAGLPVEPDPDGTPLARVFRTIADPYVGKVSLLEVLSGTLHPDVVLTNPRTHSDERLHALFSIRGKEQEPVAEAQAGDLVAVGRLGDVATGDTLVAKGSPVIAPFPSPPNPVLSIAIRPRSKGDDDKLMTALHRLEEEDRCMSVVRDEETHQTLLSGMGETHLQIIGERLKRKFGVELETEEAVVAYRETIASSSEAEGRYKKQTGGHGQFGVASLRLSPLPRGEGFSFQDRIVGGAIPRQFIPAVEKGVAEAMSQGASWGYPVVDLEVVCFDGKYHPVDSSEMSFKMAGSLAFKEAASKATPVLLEPISKLEVTVPQSLQGDVLGDLNARRGRVLATEVDAEGNQVIVALVPTAEVLRYAIDLRSLTGGRGHFALSHDHYDLVPSHIAERVPKRANA